MKKQQQQKLFAFKLSAKQQQVSKQKKWNARSGLAAAGCTDPTHQGDYRYDSVNGGWDNGIYC